MSDDPFADDDRTILQPASSVKHQAPVAGNPQTRTAITDRMLSGINPLERAASPLLSILMTIKTAASHPAPDQLKHQVSGEIEKFRSTAKNLVDDPKKLTMASYVLCTAIDEAALNTPWGHNSDWAQNSLLSSFHGEVRGGERFFELLKKLGANPQDNIDILELMYVCLALGYEGTYKIAKNGQATLTKVRKWLFEILGTAGRTAPHALSPQWQGIELKDRALPRMTPVWLMLAVAAAISALALFTMQIRLSEKAETTIGSFLPLKLAQLTAKNPPPPPAPDPVARPTLTDLLPAPISAGQLSVIEYPNHALVRLVGDNLFGSGRSDIDESALPLLEEITVALNRYSGRVLITGHTDNIPIRKPEFPSNLDLSEARAVSVGQILAEQIIDPDRLLAQGLGDLEPLNDNSSRELRSQNRRVEITAFY